MYVEKIHIYTFCYWNIFLLLAINPTLLLWALLPFDLLFDLEGILTVSFYWAILILFGYRGLQLLAYGRSQFSKYGIE